MKGQIRQLIASFISSLKACGKNRDLHRGTILHADILKRGLLGDDSFLSSSLVSMYAKCGAFAKAKEVVRGLRDCDVVTWNALIAGYVQHGYGKKALECFEEMQREGISPVAVTFICILKACGLEGEIDRGKQVHAEVIRQELLAADIVLGGALVDMYAKCASFAKAKEVLEGLPLRRVEAWTALIAGYTQHGHFGDALDSFGWMQWEGVSPNGVTFACVMKACGILGALDKGKTAHAEVVRQGLLGRDVILGGALVDMYARCAAFLQAKEVFEELPLRNVETWTALIAGYAQHGCFEEALYSFDNMQHEGHSPNALTFVSILKACGSVGNLHKGKQVHAEIVRQEVLGGNIILSGALVDMYAKCSAFTDINEVLEGLSVRDVGTWTALISGYTQHGHFEEAVSCFQQMQHEGISPDEVTFLCVLNACSQSGLLKEGETYFKQMSTTFGIVADYRHHVCMVDLFGRAGQFDKAVEIMKTLVASLDSPAMWRALLDACQRWGNVEVGKWAFENAVRLEMENVSVYTCMGNIYAAFGRED